MRAPTTSTPRSVKRASSHLKPVPVPIHTTASPRRTDCARDLVDQGGIVVPMHDTVCVFRMANR
jgi:hypothetical protein